MADIKLQDSTTGNVLTIKPTDGMTANANVQFPIGGGTLVDKGYVDNKPSGFKNYIINGKKVVNQSGLTSTDNSYNQDQWYKSGLNWYQPIEGDNNLINGKTYTLSWEGVATASYYVGSESSATISGVGTFTAIANGGSLTLTIAAGQNLWIKFASDAIGSTFNFVQVEAGTVVTPFEHRPYGLEASLCERFYENSGSFAYAAYSSVSAYAVQAFEFRAIKRVAPSIVLQPGTTSNLGGVDVLWANVACFSILLAPLTTGMASIGASGTASYTASARI